MLERINAASDYIQNRVDLKPQLGLILGSGLGAMADEIQERIVIPYKDIPHFPISTVEGHAGELVFGILKGKTVMAMNGRFHPYEGYSLQEVTFPVRVMKALGINHLIVTNACGGMNPDYYPGALMIIDDHINFMGGNPLIGRNIDDLGPRFPDMSRAYCTSLIDLAKKVAGDQGVDVKSGVYCAITGPSYMTRAELRMLRGWGADAVGMSTVPEVIAARHMSMEVLGIACVTDMAIAEGLEELDHETVIKIAFETRPKFVKLIRGIIEEMVLE